MDSSVKFILEKKVEKTIQNLEKNNMEAYFVQDENELIDKVKEIVKEGSTVAVGGSMTLFETGVIDLLRNGKYKFLDRYEEGLTKEQVQKVYRDSFSSDAYFVSTNALTEDGELFNIDGNGNRVAAMIYGPSTVIVVAGINKIVSNLEEAKIRVKNYAAPINAKRLNKDTPCTKVGHCVDCSSKDRICSHYVVTGRQTTHNKGRIKVIIVNKEFGY